MKPETRAALKGAIFAGVDGLGLNALCRRRNRDAVAILFYHGICDDAFVQSEYYTPLHLPASQFRLHLSYLRRHGYTFVSLTEAVRALQSDGPSSRRLVALTFDDGFVNVVRNAYPLLREFNAKGCLYVVSDCVGANQPLWVDWIRSLIVGHPSGVLALPCEDRRLSLELSTKRQRAEAEMEVYHFLMSLDDRARRRCLERWRGMHEVSAPSEYGLCGWEDLRDLDPDVMDVGSHTCTHPFLTRVSDDEVLRHEISDSKRTIEGRLGRPVSHFCYPAGEYDERVISQVAAAGYASATTAHPSGLNTRGANALLLNRIQTGGGLYNFKSSLCGSLSALSWMGRQVGS